MDREGRIIGLLGGQPDDPTWPAVVAEANAALIDAHARCTFSEQQREHRRGRYATLARGISFGGGQKVSNSTHAWRLVPDTAAHRFRGVYATACAMKGYLQRSVIIRRLRVLPGLDVVCELAALHLSIR